MEENSALSWKLVGILLRLSTQNDRIMNWVAPVEMDQDDSSDMRRLIFKDESGKMTINDATLYERLRKEFAP